MAGWGVAVLVGISVGVGWGVAVALAVALAVGVSVGLGRASVFIGVIVAGTCTGSDTGAATKHAGITTIMMMANKTVFLRLAGLCPVAIISDLSHRFLYPFYLRSSLVKKKLKPPLRAAIINNEQE